MSHYIFMVFVAAHLLLQVQGQNTRSRKRQWVSSVEGFSSQWHHTSYSAQKVVGKTDVYRYNRPHEDAAKAWISLQNRTKQYIEVKFPTPVYPTGIHIYETLNAGAVVKVTARDHDVGGKTVTLWKTDRPERYDKHRIFKPTLTNSDGICTNVIRLDLDRSAAHRPPDFGIDAIQLIGNPAVCSELEAAFHILDTNKDGKIDIESEIKNIIQDLENMFKAVRGKQQGIVTRMELFDYCDAQAKGCQIIERLLSPYAQRLLSPYAQRLTSGASRNVQLLSLSWILSVVCLVINRFPFVVNIC